MSTFTLYWLLKLDAFRALFFGSIWLFGLGGAILVIIIWNVYLEKGIKHKTACIYSTVIPFLFALSAILYSVIPTTKQMAILIVVPKVINGIESNTRLQKLPSKVLDLTDEWIEKLRPEQKDNVASISESAKTEKHGK